MFNKRTKFTLIELVIVIAVLGILSAIVIPNIGDMREKAYVAHVKSNISEMQLTVDMYFVENGIYPTNEQPTLESPQKINFELLEHDYLKTLKKYDENYWVDSFGQVYGSTAELPQIIRFEDKEINWTRTSDTVEYNAYNVFPNPLKPNKLTKDFSFSIPNTSQNGEIEFLMPLDKYIISSVDKYGLETPPLGHLYGNDNSITIPQDKNERIMYLTVGCDTLSEWIAVLISDYQPKGTNIKYEYALSDDGKTYSEFTEDFSSLSKSKKMKIKITMTSVGKVKPKLYSIKVISKPDGKDIVEYPLDLDTDKEQSMGSNNGSNSGGGSNGGGGSSSTILPNDGFESNVTVPSGGVHDQTVTIPNGSGNVIIIPNYDSSGKPNVDIDYSQSTDGGNTWSPPSSDLDDFRNPDGSISGDINISFEVSGDPDDSIVVKPPIVEIGGEKVEIEVIDSTKSDSKYKTVEEFHIVDAKAEVVDWLSVVYEQSSQNTEESYLEVMISTSSDGANWTKEIPVEKIEDLTNSRELKVSFYSKVLKELDDSLSIYPTTVDITSKTLAGDILNSNHQNNNLKNPVAIIDKAYFSYINDKEIIDWDSSLSKVPFGTTVSKAEWKINGEIQTVLPETLEVGEYTLELRIQNSKGVWSDWTSLDVKVHPFTLETWNFNYSATPQTWTVQSTGNYSLTTKGGSGGISGEFCVNNFGGGCTSGGGGLKGNSKTVKVFLNKGDELILWTGENGGTGSKKTASTSSSLTECSGGGGGGGATVVDLIKRKNSEEQLLMSSKGGLGATGKCNGSTSGSVSAARGGKGGSSKSGSNGSEASGHVAGLGGGSDYYTSEAQELPTYPISNSVSVSISILEE